MSENQTSITPCLIEQIVKRVFVITFCRRLDLFYGTSLCFDSIRTGFPESEIIVIDNGSIPQAKPKIQNLTASVNGCFIDMQPQPHWSLVQQLIMTTQAPFVILDPDVIFWERCDNLQSCISGRLIPSFHDPYTDCYTQKRLHTSFLKIGDPVKLQTTIKEIMNNKFDWQPFQPQMIEENDKWIRYDTGAVLYGSIKAITKPFDEQELNQYDHLFCGSHIDLVQPKLGAWGKQFLFLHSAVANGDMKALKGAWKLQNAFFNSYA